MKDAKREENENERLEGKKCYRIVTESHGNDHGGGGSVISHLYENEINGNLLSHAVPCGEYECIILFVVF